MIKELETNSDVRSNNDHENNHEIDCDIFDDYFFKKEQNNNVKDYFEEHVLLEKQFINYENDEIQPKKVTKKESQVINFFNKMNKRVSLKISDKATGYFAAVAKNLFKADTVDMS